MEGSAQFAPQPMYGSMPESSWEEEPAAPPQKVMSFSIRYNYPGICYMIVFLMFSAVTSLQGISTLNAMKGKDATWFMVMSGLAFAALVLGCSFGTINYRHNTQPVQDALRLNTYDKIDPATDQGSQVMDAGQISFTQDAALDLKKAMAFRNGKMFCVTPIVNTKLPGGMDQTYDFWAVGTNCCSGNAADFHCGEYDNPYAHAGLRVTSEYQVPYFKLAVKQAEATYNIKASHPIFLTWLQDPLDEVTASQDAATRYYTIGLYSYLLGQIIAVGAFALALTNLGPWLVGSVL